MYARFVTHDATDTPVRRSNWTKAAMLVVAVALFAVAHAGLTTSTRAGDIAPRVGDRAREERAAEPAAATEKGETGDRPDAADRVREGTRWQNERGVFTLVGDRVTFAKSNQAGGQNYMVLENLNLERIVRTIEENRTVTDADTLEWNIDATVTEFRGANFLLITRSVLVARPRGTTAAP
ncbi:MAG: hypothetical protein DCC68_18490 [Planctomycetota bacterium]|nr:MAG: hypothetical protein DCC68_18490 [Planctomycetota bacterium]